MSDAQVRAIISDLNRFCEQQIIMLTLEVTRNLIDVTPVDIGWARINWIPSLGAPFILNLEGVDPEAELAAARSRRAAGEARVINFNLSDGSTYITNNVPYITRLNEGHSQQAPAGFVQATLERTVRAL